MVNEEIVPRILRDINDGVLVLDSHGTILYLNNQGQELLGKLECPTGAKYASTLMANDSNKGNDGFHQFILDAVYDKDSTHQGDVPYILPNGDKRQLHLTSSFLFSDNKQDKIGVVVLFSDITEVATLNRQRRESSTCFAVLISCICLYLFLWSALRFLGVEPPGWVMSLMVEGISIIMFVIILKTTSFSIREIGLKVQNIRDTFVPDIAITIGGCVLLVAIKLVILRINPSFFPTGSSFWDWSVASPADLYYPLTAILQEFLARGVMQENLNRIFVGKYAGILSIVISSLIFGILHIAYGLPYMLAAALLLGVLGALYQKQRNIWGLSIIHYVLGSVAKFLRYLI
jgi:membrane protease YdiL (CAAX protease family)